MSALQGSRRQVTRVDGSAVASGGVRATLFDNESGNNTSSAELDVLGLATLAIEVSGTFERNIRFEGNIAGDIPTPGEMLPLQHLDGRPVLDNLITEPGQYLADVRHLGYVRSRLSHPSPSGSVTVVVAAKPEAPRARRPALIPFFDDHAGTSVTGPRDVSAHNTLAIEITGTFERNFRLLAGVAAEPGVGSQQVPLVRVDGRVFPTGVVSEPGIYLADVSRYTVVKGQLTHSSPSGLITVVGWPSEDATPDGIGVTLYRSRTDTYVRDGSTDPGDAFYERRATGTSPPRTIPHFEDGAFEVLLLVQNNLDVAMNALRIGARGAGANDISDNFIQLAGPIPAGGRAWFASEVSPTLLQHASGDRRVYELPELRLPYPFLRFVYSCSEEPTSGDVSITAFRRF